MILSRDIVQELCFHTILSYYSIIIKGCIVSIVSNVKFKTFSSYFKVVISRNHRNITEQTRILDSCDVVPPAQRPPYNRFFFFLTINPSVPRSSPVWSAFWKVVSHEFYNPTISVYVELNMYFGYRIMYRI